MVTLSSLWRKLTHTKALEKSSGRLETRFFETVYRVSYLTGLSAADDDIPYMIYSSTVKLLIVLLVCGEIWYAFTETSSLDEIAASINTTLIQFITMYRYRNMICHKDVYKKLAMSMESPYFDISTTERNHFVDYWAKKNERYLRLLLFLGNCTLAAWFLYPLVDELEYNLFIGIRLPFHYRSPIRYAFAYLVVVMAFAYISHFVMVNDLIMQAHLLHLVCQFAVLSDCFENILADCTEKVNNADTEQPKENKRFREAYRVRLGNMVNQHRSILGHVMDLRRTLSGPMLGQLAASGILICFIGYQATTTGADNITKCLMSLLFLSYNLFEFYIICRWCEEITVQSQRVGEAAYCSNWECGLSDVPGVKSCLVLVIARANKPLILTAGGMYNLSLLSYSSSFDRAAGPVKDLSINVSELQNLTNELQTIPGLNLDGFKSTGYYRIGNVGKYLSRNLRDYIFNGQGDPQEQGVVLTLFFKDTPGDQASDDETLTYFLHKQIGNEEKEQVEAYLDSQNYG